MDVVPRRFEIIPHGEEGATFPWSLTAETVERIAGSDSIASPTFAEGDALFFDERLPHRTSVGTDLTTRYTIESWFVAPSSYPAKHAPWCSEIRRCGEGAPSRTPISAPSGPAARPALLVFAAVVAVAFVLYLVLGRHQYFYLDEWDFVVDRIPAGLDDLLRPHNEHWSTLPILAYRGLYGLFGLRTYVPYQLVSIVLHLTVAVLLLVVMRRAGVGPWIATAAASLFVLFGAGSQDIVWAFQMALTGVAGLRSGAPAARRPRRTRRPARLARARRRARRAAVLGRGGDHDDRRGSGDAGASGVAHRAAPHRAARGDLRGLVAGRGPGRRTERPRRRTTPERSRASWAGGSGQRSTALGQLPGAGIALGLLLVVGLVVAWQGLDRATLRRRAAVPGALLVGVPRVPRHHRGRPSLDVGDRLRQSGAVPARGGGAHAPGAGGGRRRGDATMAGGGCRSSWPCSSSGSPATSKPWPTSGSARTTSPGGSSSGGPSSSRTAACSPTDCTVVTGGGEQHLDGGSRSSSAAGGCGVFDRKDRGTLPHVRRYDPADGNLLTARSYPIDVVLASRPAGRARHRVPSAGSASPHALEEPARVEGERVLLELRIGDELAVQAQDLLHRFGRSGSEAGQTGFPFTIVSVTMTYDPTGTSGARPSNCCDGLEQVGAERRAPRAPPATARRRPACASSPPCCARSP